MVELLKFALHKILLILNSKNNANEKEQNNIHKTTKIKVRIPNCLPVIKYISVNIYFSPQNTVLD